MVAINPFSALSTVGRSVTDQRSIAENFETFLTLLTTQLRNQNPLDPLDTNQFTQQLVQFSGVEQAVKTNQNLEMLTKLAAANTITNAVGYIGKEVTASSATVELAGGGATWEFQSSATSPVATFLVTDASGAVVFSESRNLSQGAGSFTWDGRTTTGATLTSGSYTLSMRAADGAVLLVSMSNTGIVQGVDMSGAEPLLLVGNRTIRLDQVSSIRTAPGG